MSNNDKSQESIITIGLEVNQKTSMQQFTDFISDNGLILITILLVIIILGILKFHDRVTKFLEFIISVPLYKRLTVLIIGVATTFLSGAVEQKYFYVPFITGYIITFAFNEFSLKCDIDKATSPLKLEIERKNAEINTFRQVIEEKKNKFYTVIVDKLTHCLRTRGRSDSEDLQRIRKSIEALQDIISAERTFFETPDEALRRFNNSTSGDGELILHTIVTNAPVVTGQSN